MRDVHVWAILAASVPGWALAQVPDLPKPSPAALFRTQCGTCHVLNAADGARQGPPLAGVVGRKPGSVEGYKYSGQFAQADFVWDPEHLDEYLTNPQRTVPGSVMAYQQRNPQTRAAIIAYLQDQH